MGITPGSGPFTFGAALSWVQLNLGWIVNEVETTFINVPAATPTSPLLPQNADRIAVTFVNVGANNIIIGLSAAQIAGNGGILLIASGGAVSLNVRDDFTLTTRAWFAASLSAPTSLYALELIGVVKLPPGTAPGS